MAKQNPPGAPQAPAGADKRKKMIVIAVAVLVAGGLYLKMGRAPAPAAAAGGAVAPVVAPVEGEIVEVGQMTVNLASAQLHYARVTFSVVLEASAVAGEVSARFPLLKDAALTEIGKSTPEALRTPEGVDDLRARLTARAQEIYPAAAPKPAPVLRVVLTELVVQ